jgi:hypothetical protein
VQRLAALADEMSAKGWHEAAAIALNRAIRLELDGSRTDGDDEAVALAQKRVAILDRLNDASRSLDARADLVRELRNRVYHRFRGSTASRFRHDAEAAEVMTEVSGRIRALARAHRLRDAARAVTKLPQDAPGAAPLMREALAWCESFQDSAEAPRLAGLLHQALAWELSSESERKKEFALARDLFEKAKSTGEATFAQRRVMIRADSEQELWQLADACWNLAGTVPTDQDDCVHGVAGYLEKHPAALDRAKVERTLRVGLTILPELDRQKSPGDRAAYRSALAGIAAHAGDFATFDRMVSEVRVYYTQTQPDAYQWATWAASFANASRKTDPRRSVGLFKEFDGAQGASDYWRSGEFANAAQAAADAGDTAAHAYFSTTGRALAERASPTDLYRYDLVPARAAFEARDYRRAAEHFKQTEATVARRNSDAPIGRTTMIVDQALSLALAKDLAGARRALEKPAAEWAKEAAQGRSAAACSRAHGLELAAALAMAQGVCADGERLREAAAKLHAVCRPGSSDAMWNEEADADTWRGKNACGKPAALTPALLLH